MKRHPHPEILWTPEKPAPTAPALEIVRQRGGEFLHQRHPGHVAAFCGFEPSLWVTMAVERPKKEITCTECWVVAGRMVADALGLTPDTMHLWPAWPVFPEKEKP